MGRLRRARPRLDPRVREVLDHRTKPPVPWAEVLGAIPRESICGHADSAEAIRTELAAACATREALVAWLVRAFDVLNTPDLVALMVPLKRELDELDENALNHPDRRVRRRLRELVKRVSDAAKEAPAANGMEQPAAAQAAPSDDGINPHPLDDLVARVRQATNGRRALFVSNREDPELGEPRRARRASHPGRAEPR
jgi:hypothetical protein